MSMSKLSLENLSNDLFMEIFDYLYGEHIFFSFFELNHRFKLLCISYPSLHIDTKNAILGSNMLNLIHLVSSKNIQSLKLWDEFGFLPMPLEHFSSLHSLTISVGSLFLIEVILEQLPLPNHLHHLSIDLTGCKGCVQNIITFIFDLPNLHRLELTFQSELENDFTIPHASLSLRYLLIQCSDLRDFWKLVPFIPNLFHLNLEYMTHKKTIDYISIQPNSLSKLKILQLKYAYNTHLIDYILPLCPQVKEIQINCDIGSFQPIKISDDYWKQILSPLKCLRKKEVNISGESRSATISCNELGFTDFPYDESDLEAELLALISEQENSNKQN